jgi:YidC/Oxa1 family membrane protein insertase
MGGETGTQAQMPAGMRTFMLWGMPGLILLVTGWQPGAVCAWFAAGGPLGIMQSLALQRHAVREFLMIAPFYKPRKSEVDRVPLAVMYESMYSKKPSEGSSGSASKPRPTAMEGDKNTACMKPSY